MRDPLNYAMGEGHYQDRRNEWNNPCNNPYLRCCGLEKKSSHDVAVNAAIFHACLLGDNYEAPLEQKDN